MVGMIGTDRRRTAIIAGAVLLLTVIGVVISMAPAQACTEECGYYGDCFWDFEFTISAYAKTKNCYLGASAQRPSVRRRGGLYSHRWV